MALQQREIPSRTKQKVNLPRETAAARTSDDYECKRTKKYSRFLKPHAFCVPCTTITKQANKQASKRHVVLIGGDTTLLGERASNLYASARARWILRDSLHLLFCLLFVLGIV